MCWDFSDYEPNPRCFGSICGRVVNVISGAKFVLDGKEYKMPATFSSDEKQAPKHGIHGGVRGFHLVRIHFNPGEQFTITLLFI